MIKREIEKQIQRNELAIEYAQSVREHIQWTLRDSRRRTERAAEILRRAGVLRDA